MSIYDLKPQFQNLLRPIASALCRRGVTANRVTAGACVVSVAVGALLCIPGTPWIGFIAVPVWMFLRMALNAVDGMLAREFGQKSHQGDAAQAVAALEQHFHELAAECRIRMDGI